jgi:hypothetical protein
MEEEVQDSVDLFDSLSSRELHRGRVVLLAMRIHCGMRLSRMASRTEALEMPSSSSPVMQMSGYGTSYFAHWRIDKWNIGSSIAYRQVQVCRSKFWKFFTGKGFLFCQKTGMLNRNTAWIG